MQVTLGGMSPQVSLTREKELLLSYPTTPLNPRLLETHEVFRKWMGRDYDTQLLDIVLAAAAANLMKSEPVWLMIVGGSGVGKTDLAKHLVGCGAQMVSTIHSEGALMSATKEKGETKGTGGLLREVEANGVGIVILKDFTSILSMPERGQRPLILAALREIHDGSWIRTVGVEGGRTLQWRGHLGIIGCCTTSWDAAHTAIAAMGDRFTVVRINSRDMDFRLAAGRQAMANLGKEKQKDSECRESVRHVLLRINTHTKRQELPQNIYDTLLNACNVASTARTPTEHDFRGKTTFSHDPEAPTRLPRSLTAMIQGALALGIPLDASFNMAMRCVRDSIPPIRLEVMHYLNRHPEASVNDIMYDIQRPWNAIDKAVQALYSAGMIIGTEVGKRTAYSLRHNVDVDALWVKGKLVDSTAT